MAAKETKLFDSQPDHGDNVELGADDIMKYIQENTEKDDEIDLFS
jgi:hypothetical protein